MGLGQTCVPYFGNEMTLAEGFKFYNAVDWRENMVN